jgi:hypothetical protein
VWDYVQSLSGGPMPVGVAGEGHDEDQQTVKRLAKIMW